MQPADLLAAQTQLWSGAMTRAPDTSITTDLLGLEPTKTWSLIATVFGDLQADHISGKELRTLLEPLGIRPEAMRVALHRLKKDGWIVSQKAGREVAYRLSAHGRAETDAARRDVYRGDVKFSEGWRIVLLGPGAAMPDCPHVVLERSLALVPARYAAAENVVVVAPPNEVPAWFEDRLVPEHIRRQAGELTALATRFLKNPPPPTASTSARLMFLHYWRKMALRPGVWAHIGLLPAGGMAQCHAAMCQIFESTPQTSPAP